MAQKNNPSVQAQRSMGMTLIEVIAVLAILAIVASISTAFIVHSIQAYRDVRHSLQITQQGRQIIERITRELRNAVPGTVRVNEQNCIEYYPISASGRYLGEVAQDKVGEINQIALQFLSASGQEQTALFNATNVRLSIGATGPIEFYSGDKNYTPWVMVSGFNPSTNTVTFSNHGFHRDSNANRVYFMHGNTSKLCVVDQGSKTCDQTVARSAGALQTLCLTGYRYSVNDNQFKPFNHLLSTRIASQDSPYFTANASSVDRNAVINVTLPLVDTTDERLTPITFNHQIMVRNAQ